MDIKNLTTFVHVAELGSFSRAGERLGYSQPTISVQIRQLEQELGCQLFERINHTVALTERGRELLDYAHRITRLVDEMIDDAQELTEIHGNIRLAMAEGGEDFITYGSDKSEPPYEGEVVYKDDAGAICRCFNWREAVRTMLQDHTKNAFMIIESIDADGAARLEPALEELKTLIETELGGTCEKFVVDRTCPEILIEA